MAIILLETIGQILVKAIVPAVNNEQVVSIETGGGAYVEDWLAD